MHVRLGYTAVLKKYCVRSILRQYATTPHDENPLRQQAPPPPLVISGVFSGRKEETMDVFEPH